MPQSLVLVRLSAEQISKARAVNGPKRKITHAVLCGNYGQLFGTEKQCRPYFSAWAQIFPLLFSPAVEADSFEIVDYKSTFNLVIKLIGASDALRGTQMYADASPTPVPNRAKKGLFVRLFGRSREA